jgi:hypothetical protein
LIIFKKRNNKIRDKIHGLANNTIELTPEEFMKMRSSPFFVKEYDFTGVYIIFNESQNMHYIGKSTNVFIRINSHFTGKGNGDIYAD